MEDELNWLMLLYSFRIFPILFRNTSGYFLEQSGHVLRVLESCLVGYLADTPVGFQKEVFYFVNDCLMDAFDSGFSRLFLYHVAEIVGREMELVSAPGHRRQSQLLWFARTEIIVQQCVEAGQYIAVQDGTGGELALIETKAVVEQYLNVGNDDAPAVLVNVVPEFLFYLSETVEDGLPFAFGHV